MNYPKQLKTFCDWPLVEMLVRAGFVLCLILCVSRFAVGQTPESSWDTLRQLTPGQKIQVVDMKLKSTKGEFRAFSDQAISLKRGKDELLLQRSDILRVNARGGGRRTNALVGGIVGLVIGFLGGAVVDALDDVDRTDPGSNNGKISAAAVGFGIGAGVGAIFPGYHTIYRSPTSKD
jgi:hypothetical protein